MKPTGGEFANVRLAIIGTEEEYVSSLKQSAEQIKFLTHKLANVTVHLLQSGMALLVCLQVVNQAINLLMGNVSVSEDLRESVVFAVPALLDQEVVMMEKHAYVPKILY